MAYLPVTPRVRERVDGWLAAMAARGFVPAERDIARACRTRPEDECQRCHDSGFIAEGRQKGQTPCDACGKDAYPWQAPEARAEREAKIAACAHDYQRQPYSGSILEYVCAHCGDSYERDVS